MSVAPAARCTDEVVSDGINVDQSASDTTATDNRRAREQQATNERECTAENGEDDDTAVVRALTRKPMLLVQPQHAFSACEICCSQYPIY